MGGVTRPSWGRNLGMLALAAAVLVSGCASKPNAQTATVAGGMGPGDASFGADTGAIRGSVVAEDQTPIQGAQVALQGHDSTRPVSTDVGGNFGFGHLDPGTYNLLVASLGFASAAKAVEVKAGEATEVKVVLQATQVQGLKYTHIIGPIPGKFFCAFYAAVTGPCKAISFGIEDGTWNQVSGGESNIWVLPKILSDNRSRPDDALSGAVVEVSWTPATGAAKWLWLSLEELQCSGDHTGCGRSNAGPPTYGEATGAGPLKAMAIPGLKSAGGSKAMPANETGFTIGVFPYGDPSVEDPVAHIPITPSAYTEQPFSVWITTFFNGAPPPDYTVLKG